MKFQHNRDWQVYDAKGLRKYVTGSERRRVLAAANDRRPDIQALAYFLTYTGCRISEALALLPEHFDRETVSVTVGTLKRRRVLFRTIPIPMELWTMVAALQTPPGRQIWLLHRVTAWRHLKAMFKEADVAGPMACCRGLRHGFGIQAAITTVPPNLIQKWMGHATLSTTSIYLDAVGEEERCIAERLWNQST